MNLDLVSLAVEGSEFSVLKGVDFEAVDIARLLIECRDIDRMVGFLAPTWVRTEGAVFPARLSVRQAQLGGRNLLHDHDAWETARCPGGDQPVHQPIVELEALGRRSINAE